VKISEALVLSLCLCCETTDTWWVPV